MSSYRYFKERMRELKGAEAGGQFLQELGQGVRARVPIAIVLDLTHPERISGELIVARHLDDGGGMEPVGQRAGAGGVGGQVLAELKSIGGSSRQRPLSPAWGRGLG
jgi:hypothetical protein